MYSTTFGNCTTPNGQSGILPLGSQSQVIALGITATLVGTLTVTGVNNADGSPATWTYPPGTTTGLFTPPASGLANRLAFSLSSASDIGKVLFAWQPL